MRHELWIIEAPGKIATLEKSLAALGRKAEVVATVGYIMTFRGWLGITPDLRDVGRVPVNDEIIPKLREAACGAGQVYIATDSDSAGNVIALDVAQAIADIAPSPLRVRLAGLDRNSVKRALREAGPVTAFDAAAGRGRAMIDRILGVAFSTGSGSTGRIKAALLSRVSEAAPGCATVYTLVAPATDFGPAFHLDISPDQDIGADVLEKLMRSGIRPVLPGDPCQTGFSPRHFGDILVAATDTATRHGESRSVAEIGRTFQQLYSDGKTSYLRSNTRGYSEYAHARIVAEAGWLGAGVEPNERTIRANSRNGHDAPYLLESAAPVTTPGMLTPNHLMAEIHQANVRATHFWPVQIPDSHDLRQALMEAGIDSAMARKLSQRRWLRWDGAIPPGMKNHSSASRLIRRSDAAVLGLMLEHGIGKAGSWPNVPEALTGGGDPLVVGQGGSIGLTPAGQDALAATPDFLRDPNFSASVEAACIEQAGSGEQPWRQIVISVMENLPAEAKARVRQTLIDGHGPRASRPQPEMHVPSIADLGVDTSVRAEAPQPVLAPLRFS